ncbi:uncharacterized protein CCOS01_06618 [Colletotrichum costaricense]|uniref:Uncharacterized protein n=1 Tax=Colletotrichum costaricense TaxID=1209916 RepID=A0AAI9YYR4_9PEZI|nr:uncharacterized protein CCOS01_06618 [Colletotrichum costaricense]KAK1528784.1 hypothetical protein CCOS01_06618 [Colletotrichum costaricense]
MFNFGGAVPTYTGPNEWGDNWSPSSASASVSFCRVAAQMSHGERALSVVPVPRTEREARPGALVKACVTSFAMPTLLQPATTRAEVSHPMCYGPTLRIEVRKLEKSYSLTLIVLSILRNPFRVALAIASELWAALRSLVAGGNQVPPLRTWTFTTGKGQEASSKWDAIGDESYSVAHITHES